MKKNVLFLFLVSSIQLLAQPTFKVDLGQSVGNEWGLGLWGADSFDALPIPESGENKVWDFAFLGNEDNANGVLFSEAVGISDFLSFYSFNDPSGLPTAGGGTVQDSFPDAIGCLLTDFFAYERYGVAMGQMGGEIIFYGNVDEVNSIFETDAGGSPQISIVQPLPQQLNESLVTSNLEVEIDPDFNSLDSIFSYDSIVYIGYGTIKMFYGDLENVVLTRGFSQSITLSFNLTTGAFMSVGVSRTVSYNFYQSGNLIPVLSYFFSTDANGQPTFDGPSLFVGVPFFTPINSANETSRIPLRLKVSPNPVVDLCRVSFQLYKPGPVGIELISTNGKHVFEKKWNYLDIGNHQVSLTLPSDLLTGLYFLKTTAANGQAGITKVMIE